MSVICNIEIEYFRTIKQLFCSTKQGLNFLIGSGYSGNSTLPDTMDLTFGTRYVSLFTDASFCQLDITSPLTITITIDTLDRTLRNIETCGFVLRGYYHISDELQPRQNTVLTIKVQIHKALYLGGRLLYGRNNTSRGKCGFPWTHSVLSSPTRLGATTDQNFIWYNCLILNKLSEDKLDMLSLLVKLRRKVHQDFNEQQVGIIPNVLQLAEVCSKTLIINNVEYGI
ncbi:hypothetical protein DVQ87_08405 [Yersinia enterocolitica]|nr:hypothetical protein [Yersinia enterocolitica]